jgi:O-antigen/teichoic acid export membrane protein
MLKKIGLLFLKNIGIRQTIVKNTIWLSVAEFIGKFLNIALLVYAARILGATDYGRFAFAMSFVSILAIFADLGLYEIVTREFSKSKEAEKEYSSIISLKFFLSIFTLILIIIGSFFVTSDNTSREIIIILSFFILITSFFNVIYAFYRARQKMEYESISTVLQMVFITIIGFVVLFKIPSATNLALGYLLANVIIFFLFLFLFHFFVHKLEIKIDFAVWKKFLKNSWPLTFGFAMGWIYIYINSVIMGYYGQLAESGWYNAAYKILGATVISATIISRSFYPALNKLHKDSKEKFGTIWKNQIESMAFIAIPILLGGLILAPKIILFLFGKESFPSISIFRILIFVCIIDFLYYPFATLLVVLNKQKLLFYSIFLGAVINTILTILLVPRYSYLGAGISAVISSFVVFLVVVKRSLPDIFIFITDKQILKSFLKFIFAGIVMSIIINLKFVYNLNVVLVIIIGAFVYFFVIFLFYRKSLISVLKQIS